MESQLRGFDYLKKVISDQTTKKDMAAVTMAANLSTSGERRQRQYHSTVGE